VGWAALALCPAAINEGGRLQSSIGSEHSILLRSIKRLPRKLVLMNNTSRRTRNVDFRHSVSGLLGNCLNSEGSHWLASAGGGCRRGPTTECSAPPSPPTYRSASKEG